MKHNTLCIPLTDDRVLLGMKKRGFGEGKWNGFGGKVTEGETALAAAIRELSEESSLEANETDLEKVAVVNFYFDNVLTIVCDVFLLRTWEGEPVESEEMRPQWFAINNLPYADMWAADGEWFPLVLSGKSINADVHFNTDGSVVENFSYTETSFE